MKTETVDSNETRLCSNHTFDKSQIPPPATKKHLEKEKLELSRGTRLSYTDGKNTNLRDMLEKPQDITLVYHLGLHWTMRLTTVGTSREPADATAMFISGMGYPPTKDKDSTSWTQTIENYDSATNSAEKADSRARIKKSMGFRQAIAARSAGPWNTDYKNIKNAMASVNAAEEHSGKRKRSDSTEGNDGNAKTGGSGKRARVVRQDAGAVPESSGLGRCDYILKISLEGTGPKITRVLICPPSMSFYDLHLAI